VKNQTVNKKKFFFIFISFGKTFIIENLSLALNDSKTRYITILGFGGMGKTTVAIQAVKELNSHSDFRYSFFVQELV